MDDRWVCQRCFESNLGSAFTCTRCGLLRGATPPAGEAQWTPVDQPQASAGGGWGDVVRRFGWIPVVAIVALGGFLLSARRDDSGQITNSGNMAIADLRVGDCFDVADPDAETFEEVTAKPCAEPHGYEMFYVEDVPADAFPGDEVFITWAEEHCKPAFEAFVGISYDVSMYYIYWFSPTQDSWGAGDHSVQCAAYNPDDPALIGTLRGAAR